jgi:hypothetical protein
MQMFFLFISLYCMQSARNRKDNVRQRWYELSHIVFTRCGKVEKAKSYRSPGKFCTTNEAGASSIFLMDVLLSA